MPGKKHEGTYLWCDHCRRSFNRHDAPDGVCPMCGREMQPVGKLNAILRGLMANELAPSLLYSRHLQMIKLIWTRNGMGEQYYRILAPDMSYSRFEKEMTAILCRGATAGWVEFAFPAAPDPDEARYTMRIVDESAFLAAIQTLAGSESTQIGEE